VTLRWRLTLLYTGLTALLLTLGFAVSYLYVQNLLTTSFQRELFGAYSQAITLVRGTKDFSPGQINWDGFTPTAFAQLQQYYRTEFNANDAAFNLIPGTKSPNLQILGAEIALPQEGYEALERFGEYAGAGFLQDQDKRVLQRIQVRATRLQPIEVNGLSLLPIVTVGKDFSGTQQLLDTLRQVLTFVALLGIAAAGIATFLVAGSALEPIRAVRNAAAAIGGAQNLNLRVPEQGTKDEVDDLAKTLNEMLERVETSFETQRRFTADASHELRTPVTAIAGHASYLMRRTNPTDTQKESLEAISTLSSRLGRLIGDLLDLARADAGFGVEPVDTNLMALAEDVHLEVVAIAGNAEIEITGDRAIRAKVDPNRVRQVIRNLVQNAIKAGSSRVEVNVSKDGNRAKIGVIDNGSGISREHLNRLFDRFYRVDTSRDRAAGGSGLGLSIVKWIVEAHHGTIQVSSEIGKGTRFDVFFPLEPKNEAKSSKPTLIS
jgi:two-component system, OmpR family, sensor kinase